MPTMRRTVTVPIVGDISAWDGLQDEYLRFNRAKVEFAFTTPDAVNGGFVRATVYSGGDLIQQNSSISVKPAGDSTPRYPDDFLVQDVAQRSDRISGVLSAPGAAAPVLVDAVAIITPF